MHTLSLNTREDTIQAKISQMSWLAGYWYGGEEGQLIEEVWTPPSGGSMMGSFKMLKNGKVVFYELQQIVEINGGLMLQIKHFGPELHGWEEKTETEDFALVKITDDTACFDGLSFVKDGQDGLIIYVRQGEGEEVHELSFHYKRRRL